MVISIHRVILSLLTLFIVLGIPVVIFAHPGHYGSPFHAHNLADAVKYSEQEHRIVFLHLRKPGGKRLHIFRWPGNGNADLIDLLVRETVIVELEAQRDADQVQGIETNPPEILLMNPDGSIKKRIDGSLNMHLVARELRSQLTGEDAVDRARLNLRTKGRDDFFSRERLASALRHAGHIEEAVAEYAWCAGQAVEAKTLAAKSRRSKLFAAITDFARENPAADNLLNGILDDAETSLLKEKDDPLLARDLTQIYQKSKKARAKTFFNQLDKESRARHGLLDLLFDDLVAEGRYQEVLKLIDPLEAFKGEVKRYQRNRILRPALAEHGKGRGTRSFVIQRSLALTQALAETGETAKASTLMKNLLEFDNRETTQQALRESLGKAGRLDLIQE